MSDEHLLRIPHKIKGRRDAWWYEETELITIPWSEIRKALARKDKP